MADEFQNTYAGRRHCNGLFFPLLLIVLGSVFLLTEFNLVEPWRAWAFFWPFILVFFGIRLLATQRVGLGAVAIAFGVALAGEPLNLWDFNIGRYWPLLLIALGISMLARPGWLGARRRELAGAGPGNDSVVDGLGVLGGFQRRVTAQNFSGGNLTACFGGFNVDLTRAGISGERAVIDITACFGGGEIRVPNSWIVDLRGQGFFGAFQDESRQTPAEGAKTLVVTGIALFGGVVIKN